MSRTLVVTNDFPPAAGRHPDVRAALLARRPPDSAGRAGLALPGVGRVRRRRSRSRWSAGPPRCCCRPRATARAAADWPGGTAATGCSSAPRRRSACSRPRCAAPAPAGSSRDPRPRDRLGGAARQPGSCCGGSPARLDVLTYVSEYTRARLEPALGRPHAAGRGSRRAWTSTAFTPAADGAEVRRRHGLGDGARSSCASPGWCPQGPGRADPGWPPVLARHPDARPAARRRRPDGARSARAAAARLGSRAPWCSPAVP